MADTLLGPVITKLIDLVAEEVKSLTKVRKQVMSLQDELKIIEPFLRHAEAELEKGNINEEDQEWVKQVRKEGNRIEAIIDEYLYYVEVEQHHRQNGVIDRRQIYQLLRPLEQGASSTTTNVKAPDPRLSSLFIEKDELVGIERKSEEIIRQLVEGSPTRSVISLVGEGGIGKTTLAKNVYDEVVMGFFESHAWVTVSRSYNLKKLLVNMKKQICKSEHGMEEMDNEVEQIQDMRVILKEKRLYRFWIAEGFVKARRDMTMEERNLVTFELVVGEGKSCGVHDLMRDVILSRADEVSFCRTWDGNKSSFSGEGRRLIISGRIGNVLKNVDDSTIRVVFLIDIDGLLTESFIVTLFKKFKLLEVVDLDSVPLNFLPKEMGNLFQLKYLSLRNSNVKILPKFIGNLHKLQSLDIRETSILELPVEINKL
ncbi:hypothetical protein UlMin_004495 [Ulmus minor]